MKLSKPSLVRDSMVLAFNPMIFFYRHRFGLPQDFQMAVEFVVGYVAEISCDKTEMDYLNDIRIWNLMSECIKLHIAEGFQREFRSEKNWRRFLFV